MFNYIIPCLILFIFIYAIFKKVNLYKTFCNGAKKSLTLCFDIFPYILTIMIAITLFRISGLSNLLVDFLSPLFVKLGLPKQVCELVLLRPFTGSGSVSLVADIIAEYGAKSYIARCACVIMGSSETVFYVCAVYFSKLKIKGVAKAILIALIGNFVGAIISCYLCLIM